MLYALAREYHQRLAGPALTSFTPVKIVQTFYYLATHCNYKGTKITLDIPDVLKHVEDIRYTNLAPLLGALDALRAVTAAYAEGFDFIVEALHLDRSDWAYADTQASKTETDRLLCAVKHHLKSHNNTLVLGVKYTSEKAGVNRRKI